VRMPLFPWLQYAGLLMLGAILLTMGLDPDLRVSWVYGVPWLILISAAYFLWRARSPSQRYEVPQCVPRPPA
jgi:amino acid transporter, AAT family